MKSARAFFDQLNQDYLELHRLEGDLYWLTHTGQSDEHDALGAAGLARKTFLADPQRLAQIRAHLARLEAATQSVERDPLLTGLRGWVGVNGNYDFRANPQRGLGQNNVIMVKFTSSGNVAASKFGGVPLR